jgi:phosphate starvation-inducible PhoH-like protein
LLKGVPGIDFVTMDSRDIVRHKLVTSIVNAYDKADKEKKKEK